MNKVLNLIIITIMSLGLNLANGSPVLKVNNSGDPFIQNGITCDNINNFCESKSANSNIMYETTLNACVDSQGCPNYAQNIYSNNPAVNTGRVNNYLVLKYQNGITDIPSARFKRLDNCQTVNLTQVGQVAQSCTVILSYAKNDGTYAEMQSGTMASFVIQLNSNCNLKGGICIAKDAKEPSKLKLTTDPINLNARSVVDAKLDINFPISFGRYYDSGNKEVSYLGQGWKTDLNKQISIPKLNSNYNISFIASEVSTQNQTGIPINPTLQNTLWVGIEDGLNDTLFFYRDNLSSPWKSVFKSFSLYDLNYDTSKNQFNLKLPNGDIKTYDGNTGLIVKELNKNGTYLNYYYTGTLLTKISNHLGQWISFSYSNYANILTQVSASNGDYVNYNYTNGYLTQVIFNGQESFSYQYENGLLVDRYNENGQHLVHYTYNANGEAIGNYQFDKDGNIINQQNLTYTSDYVQEDKQNGNILFHYFSNSDNANEWSYTYNVYGGNGYYFIEGQDFDNNGNIIAEYNAVGGTQSYTYDSNNFLTSIRKINGQTSNIIWDTTNKLILSMTEQTSNGSRNISYSYDSNNNVISKTIQGNNETLTWQYTWSNNGRLLTQKSPNGLMTNYEYYDIDGSSSSGLLKKITTSSGKVITIDSYDIRGNATSITGIDGISKTMTYDMRGRLLTETVNGATNYYNYDLVGNLVLTTFANGYQLKMTYDSSNRLYKIEDNNGGSEVFTLDSATGKTLNESIYQNGTLIKTLNQILDKVGNTTKLYKSDISKSYTITGMFNDGSVSYSRDPNGVSSYRRINSSGLTTSNYYADDNSGYSYDLDNNISSININDQQTNYNYDDFGRLTQLVNPDTGSQIMSYDTINGVKNRVDANNITHKISSDIEGKILTISHTNNNGSLLENFEYYSDNKLKKITDNSGSISFGYNNYGMLNQKTQNINGKDFNIYYENNNIGQLTFMTYPSGMTVHYDYNKGFVSNIYVNGTDIIKNVTYNSIEKEATSWVLGANTVAITKNSDGDVTNFVDNGVLNETLTVDGMSQISSVKDSINANNNISANYNYNYSISNWTNNVGNQSHGTTTNFNISSISGNGSSYSWNYITGTNKTSNYSYDNNGNVITDNKGNYVYDLKNNMISATRNNVTGNYYYNALNQRVIKSVNGQIRYFVYNESNQLIGEYDSTGNVITEYIYFGLRPVAIKTNGNIYMVHTDYLGTPRYILDNASNMLWKWERRDPYGNNVAQGTIEFNLRFAGQYYDVESGLNYNINRMYDSDAKRYMQSDPMGLMAGWNTYNYVGRNPLNYIDPLGLSSKDISKILATFINTENQMVLNNQKIPGDNSADDNNKRAFLCNPAFDRDGDKWQVIQQNGKNHDWVVMYSNNKNDPILYLDPWAYQITKDKICNHCEKENLSPTNTELYTNIYRWRNK